MKTYKLPENILVGIINYLGQRPYAEVAEAIPQLQSLEEIVAPVEKLENAEKEV